MKKRFLLLPLIAIGAYVTLSSNIGGYLSNATGSNGGTVGCGGGGCHSNTASSTVTQTTIIVDSAGTLVTVYHPGVTYRVSLAAGTAATSGLTKFGFQLSSSKAASAAQAGTWVAATAPVNATVSAMGPFSVVRHTAPMSDSVILAGAAFVYPVSIQWTAPAAGTGAVKFFGVINAVNNNTNADAGDLWNSTTTTITEYVDHTLVSEVAAKVAINTFPNPVTSSFTLQLSNAAAGTYGVQVMDITGKIVVKQSVEVTGNTASSTINLSNFAAGRYHVVVEKDGVRTVKAIVKQ
ncbi:hypothetical protein CJD36_020855 [Flavipsychrobacter stenotrophus]|uniref:Secretion system C-terminal sorting domain-containing protein n=1 Tax=Flavipsychrobacter stenotrophus TaxID=2077091 RepID=A0A2S7SQX6_9BACT|nr:T9SS type A sorting domain-containing protein [Flavipsychrobacter stenotrophus]PQJ09031.1 hypothetical protein CJD36_020855 [Flavipsychrobacter stenotrophus]